MLKKTFTYTDYNGQEVTEDHYFNLTKAELLEMEMTTPGGMAETLDAIVKAKDSVSIVNSFKDLIRKSYGKKSPDGKRFMKSEEIFLSFSETEAYSQLFMELATDANAAADFVNGIIPPVEGLEKKIAELKNNA